MSDAAARSSSAVAYRLVSLFSACFTGLVILGPPRGLGALSDATFDAVAVFCLLVYLFLQFTVASHQSGPVQTKRARTYFWLLALFPLWSLPTATLLIQAIVYVGGRL